MTFEEVSLILGRECIIKWKEKEEELCLTLICCQFSLIEKSDYSIDFVNDSGTRYRNLIRISQISHIFISKITNDPVIVLIPEETQYLFQPE